MRGTAPKPAMIDSALVFVDLLALFIIVWVFQLVRRDRLYVGFGVIFVIVIAMGSVILTFPATLGPLNAFSSLAERSIVVMGLALVFVVLMLIYILSQTTLLSNRVARLTQELAIRDVTSNRSPDHPAAP